MKKINTLLLMLVTAAFTNAGTIEMSTPVDNTPIMDVTTEYSSEKIWRGSDVGQNEADVTLTTDLELPVEIDLQLGASYSTVDGSETSSDEATELSAVFSKSVLDYFVSLSYTWYSEGFNQSGDTSAQEVGLSFSRKIGLVDLTLTQYIATQGDNNGYSELKGEYSSNFNVLPLDLDFVATVGYLVQDSAFTHAELYISTDVPIIEDIIAQPFVAYSTDLGGEFIDNFSGDNFFGGVQFKRAF